MAQDDINSPQRRVVIRRGRNGGFHGGGAHGSNRLDGAPRDTHEEDAVDAAIDPMQMNRAVAQLPAPPTAGARHDDGPENPRDRLFQVMTAGSATYSKEYRLNLLHRLLMRKIPLDQIARQFGVSISTIEKDRVELKKRLREAARELDINEMIGNQTELYDEIAGMGLRVASNAEAPTAMRLAAMRTSLAANADKARFYQSAGVFDVLRFRRAEDGASVSDVQQLMENTERMLQQLTSEKSDEPAAPKPAKIRRRARGFKDFQDTDQHDHAEVVDL